MALPQYPHWWFAVNYWVAPQDVHFICMVAYFIDFSLFINPLVADFLQSL